MCNCIGDWEENVSREAPYNYPDKKYTGKMALTSVRKFRGRRVSVVTAVLETEPQENGRTTHHILAIPKFCCFCGDKIDYGD